jgi:uncharacterized protein (DUF427 family)
LGTSPVPDLDLRQPCDAVAQIAGLVAFYANRAEVTIG